MIVESVSLTRNAFWRYPVARFLYIYSLYGTTTYYHSGSFPAGRPPPLNEPRPPLRVNEGWALPDKQNELQQKELSWADRPVKTTKPPIPLNDAETALFNSQSSASRGIHPSRLVHITGRSVEETSEHQDTNWRSTEASQNRDNDWSARGRDQEQFSARSSRDWNSATHDRPVGDRPSVSNTSRPLPTSSSKWDMPVHRSNPIEERSPIPNGPRMLNTHASASSDRGHYPAANSSALPRGSAFVKRDDNERPQSSKSKGSVPADSGGDRSSKKDSGWSSKTFVIHMQTSELPKLDRF